MYKKIMIAISACTILSATPAFAETDIIKRVQKKVETVRNAIKASCQKDVKEYCGKVTPGRGRLALCMLAHEDKISNTCYGAVLDVAEAIDLTISMIWKTADVCEADIDKTCGDVIAGGGRITQCLITNKDKLSKECITEIKKVQEHLTK